MARGKHKGCLNRSHFTVTGKTPKPKKKYGELPLWDFLRLVERKMGGRRKRDD